MVRQDVITSGDLEYVELLLYSIRRMRWPRLGTQAT